MNSMEANQTMEHLFYADGNKIGIWDDELGRSIIISDNFPSHLEALLYIFHNKKELIERYEMIKGGVQ